MLDATCSKRLLFSFFGEGVQGWSSQHMHSLLRGCATCVPSNYINPGTEVLETAPNITRAAKSDFFQALMHNLSLCWSGCILEEILSLSDTVLFQLYPFNRESGKL